MVQRYDPHGNMQPSPTGAYVEASDYDALLAKVQQLLEEAAVYCDMVERGQITATDAAAALRVCARI
jgi:hypothetical protein